MHTLSFLFALKVLFVAFRKQTDRQTDGLIDRVGSRQDLILVFVRSHWALSHWGSFSCSSFPGTIFRMHRLDLVVELSHFLDSSFNQIFFCLLRNKPMGKNPHLQSQLSRLKVQAFSTAAFQLIEDSYLGKRPWQERPDKCCWTMWHVVL